MKRAKSGSAPRLDFELERGTLVAIRAAYSDINDTFFKGQLRRPVFALSDTGVRLGQYDATSRTLEISRALLVRHGWGSVIDVLKHEMAHQYVLEVLKVDEAPHGATFRRICEERGFHAAATGVPRPTAVVDSKEGALLDKISRLLALAESPNEHEAHAAMNAAQRLMFKYNLAAVSRRSTNEYDYRHLGEPTGRVNEAQRILAGILSSFFFVETIWVSVWRPLVGKRGSVIEVCGTHANLEMAEYAHGFLEHTAQALWRQHKRATGLKSDKDRQAFLAGVMTGFHAKLEAERRHQKQDGLVWVGDPELQRYLRQRHRYIRHARYVSSERQAAHAQGRAAGSRIVLHKGISSGPGIEPRLLGR